MCGYIFNHLFLIEKLPMKNHIKMSLGNILYLIKNSPMQVLYQNE